VSGAHGGAVELDDAAAFEDAVEDGGGEVFVVEDGAPGVEGLVGGEDHRAFSAVALVDDVEEHVGGVGAVGEVADFIDDEHVRMDVAGECLAETSLAECGGEVVDERGCGGEEGFEAVLQRAIGDGDREVGFAASGLSGKDDSSALGDEVSAEGGAEDGQSQRGLMGEVEFVDGLEKGEAGTRREATEARLGALGDLFGHQVDEEIGVGPVLLLGARDGITPDTSCVGEVEPLEGGVEVEGFDDGGAVGGHGNASFETMSRSVMSE
jgi:hypothetical protein